MRAVLPQLVIRHVNAYTFIHAITVILSIRLIIHSCTFYYCLSVDFQCYLPIGSTCCCLLQIIFKWLLLPLQCVGNEKKSVYHLFLVIGFLFTRVPVHMSPTRCIGYTTDIILRGLWHSLRCCRLFYRMFSVCTEAATTDHVADIQ